MTKSEKELLLDKLDIVINSRNSTLSNKDVEHLVSIREKLRNDNSKEGLLKLAKEILRFFIDD
jgi:hypothetical protein